MGSGHTILYIKWWGLTPKLMMFDDVLTKSQTIEKLKVRPLEPTENMSNPPNFTGFLKPGVNFTEFFRHAEARRGGVSPARHAEARRGYI